MPLVRLLVITDCCLLAACLVMIGILGLLRWHDRRLAQGGRRGRHEQGERQGRHRQEGHESNGRRRRAYGHQDQPFTGSPPAYRAHG
jgi:hypothetical protein